ncbi:MAG: NUDIX domain-containing protein [Nanoarchaeota archaeon]
MNERPKIGVGVIIIKHQKILLMKRKGAHGEGEWALPGGHLEFGESVEQYAKREIIEELGVEVEEIKKKSVYTEDIFQNENKHYITLYCFGKIIGIPKICEPDKCTEMNWFDFNNLPSPLFLPVKNLVKEGFKFE